MDLQNHIKGFSVALFENQVASGESLPFEYMLGTQMINDYVTSDLGIVKKMQENHNIP